MVIKKMQKTKVIVALVAIAALTLTIVGLAAAQLTANQPYINTGASPNNYAANGGFWGWIGNCFGFRSTQPYGTQYVAPTAPKSSSVPAPNQGGYYGYGPCMRGW